MESEDQGPSRTLLIVQGILFLILGFLALAVPFLFTIGFELMVGWLLIFGGLALGYRTLKSGGGIGFLFSLIGSIAYLVTGALMLFYPMQGVITLTVLLTIFFLVQGIAEIIYAFSIRHTENWWWLLLGGIASVAIAFLVWRGWPESSSWLLGLLLGVNLIFYGVGYLFLSASTPKKPV